MLSVEIITKGESFYTEVTKRGELPALKAAFSCLSQNTQ